MNLPDKNIIQWIHALTHSTYSFALYRLPWTDECIFILQTNGKAKKLDDISGLNGKRGFVIAPFRLSDNCPLVIIQPDVLVTGWEEIQKVTFPLEGSTVSSTATCHLMDNQSTGNLEEYQETFQQFIHPLKDGTFQKLVLSRTESQTLDEHFSPLKAFVNACNSYPRMMIYLCHTPATGTWIGSTPEILLSGHEKEWHTVALAGTMPMQGITIPDTWSEKNKEEQAMVADYIRNIIKKYGGKMEERGPYTARAGQLVHLKTDFHFQLKETRALGALLKELHPTPAVCGLPKAEAYTFIHRHEKHERKYYSGFIGWLDPDGQTDLYVNLRCMEIHPGKAVLYAGGGILPSSETASEWDETNEKMKTMKNII